MKQFSLKIILNDSFDKYNKINFLRELIFSFDDISVINFLDISYGNEPESKTFDKVKEDRVYDFFAKHDIEGIDLISMKEVWKYRGIDFGIIMNFSFKNYFTDSHNLTLAINLDTHHEFLNKFLELIYKSTFISENIDYGYSLVKPSIKNPYFLVSGIGNDKLTNSEKKLVDLWANNQDKSDKQILDIFWLNILTDNHLPNEEIKQEITNIVGKEYFYKLNDNAYMLQVPVDIEEADGEEFEIYRKALYEVFEKYDKVIKWDD